MTHAPLAPLELHSIRFDFPGGRAIRLKDPGTDEPVGSRPEWVAGQPPAPVAYVRGTTPRVRVVFRGTPGSNGEYVIGAAGTPCGVTRTQVALAFDPVSGLSGAVPFAFDRPLPDAIGVHAVHLVWHACEATAPGTVISLGASPIDICTTWRAMTPNRAQGLDDSVYSPVVMWTSQWAAGAGDEKEICDAIIRNVASSGLRYGVGARTVRDMLLRRGGMCGIWYQMFQQMAHSQGVFVHRRAFLVDWRPFPSGENRWCAIVVKNSGLNQSAPTHPIVEFHDHDGPLTDVGRAPLANRVEARYRFWGLRGGWFDGHCVNFLEYGGRVYLYDACFGGGPFDVGTELPPADLSIWGGRRLATIKARYLDPAIDYMLGALYNQGRFWPSSRGTSSSPERIGVTVRTAQIPETDGGIDGLSFGWTE